MRDRGLLIVAVLLSSCATAPEKILSDKPPMKIYESTKSPTEIVQCMNNNLHLPAEARNGDWSISNKNSFGSILINWYVRAKGTGSVIELRRTQSMAPGISAAERCF